MCVCMHMHAHLGKKPCASIYIKFNGQPLPVVILHVISRALSRRVL